jgi:hypothetical protein
LRRRFKESAHKSGYRFVLGQSSFKCCQLRNLRIDLTNALLLCC